MARAFLLIAVVLSLLLLAQCSKPKRKAVALDDEEVVQAKDFALKEIIKLSDSYRDMKIAKLVSAEKARSAFSDGTNFFLKMELSCVSKCEAPLSPASTCRRGKYKGTNEIIVFWKDDGHYDGIAIDEFPQMDGEFHPCTPSYKGSEKCNPAEHRTPEQAALFMDDPEDDRCGGSAAAGVAVCFGCGCGVAAACCLSSSTFICGALSRNSFAHAASACPAKRTCKSRRAARPLRTGSFCSAAVGIQSQEGLHF